MIHAMWFRVGSKVGRTIYLHTVEGDEGALVGVMDTRELAAKVVDALNRMEDDDDKPGDGRR